MHALYTRSGSGSPCFADDAVLYFALMKATRALGIGAILAMVAIHCGFAEDVNVRPVEVTDAKVTSRLTKTLRLEMKFILEDFDAAKGFRYTVTNAVDDTGKDLTIEEEKKPQFYEAFRDRANKTLALLTVKNPSLYARTVRQIMGEVEIFRPESDPAATAIFSNFLGKSTFTLANSSLTAAKIQITVISREQYVKDEKRESQKRGKSSHSADASTIERSDVGKFVILQIKDPEAKLVGLVFLDAAGNLIPADSRSRSGETSVYRFPTPLPNDVKLRVYVATFKSILKVPFAIKDLPVPDAPGY
jgi:hypothetical protein